MHISLLEFEKNHSGPENRDCSHNKGTSGWSDCEVQRVARQMFAEAQTAWFSIDDATGLPASSPKLRRPLGRVSSARDVRQRSSPQREQRLHYSPIVSQIVSREDRCGFDCRRKIFARLHFTVILHCQRCLEPGIEVFSVLYPRRCFSVVI